MDWRDKKQKLENQFKNHGSPDTKMWGPELGGNRIAWTREEDEQNMEIGCEAENGKRFLLLTGINGIPVIKDNLPLIVVDDMVENFRGHVLPAVEGMLSLTCLDDI